MIYHHIDINYQTNDINYHISYYYININQYDICYNMIFFII
jgi:hypothetical protein